MANRRVLGLFRRRTSGSVGREKFAFSEQLHLSIPEKYGNLFIHLAHSLRNPYFHEKSKYLARQLHEL
jgi:hypothetical protein